MFSEYIPLLIIFCGVLLILLIIIIVGIYRHLHKSAFTPKFVRLSDGSINMEFYDFGGLQTARTKRFYEQYKVNMRVAYEGKQYRVSAFKELKDNSLTRENMKIVAYLEGI